ncbi:hypothetical protein Pmi06nite_76270 [Planotetraspora mira]|uniref:Uncharacterized protein n=2 Tax=Planotetraspora mira TaxID=58121 RepID=A0A8J3U7U8_9ACTN|nr:hypothetical protein Pmi06nite_76270 [Planotetraspora mira]
MCELLDKWMCGHLATLWESAPEIPLRDRLRRIIERAWPSVVLLGLGIALPMLPVFTGAEQAAQSVRITLIVAAIVAVATGGVNVAEQVSSSLDKHIPAANKSE